jgi:DNA-binding NarL/FixJ family response regulator
MKQIPLTERQVEVAERVAQGLTNKEVARELGLSVETVRVHIREAAERLSGTAYPRHQLTVWFLNVAGDKQRG